VPALWGAQEPPAWWVVLVLGVGAVAVHGAMRLPGHGGHHPLDGLAFDIGPRAIGSALLASLATLVAGAVVGPEAPLLAIGTALAIAVTARRAPGQAQPLVMAAATAALGVVFGNPLVTGILLLESLVLAGEQIEFRGGTVFPAVFVGATLGAAAHALVPGTSLAGLVSVGIAASVGAALRLPFTAVLLAVLMLAPAGLATTVPAVLGAVVSVVAAATVADRLARRRGLQSLVTGE